MGRPVTLKMADATSLASALLVAVTRYRPGDVAEKTVAREVVLVSLPSPFEGFDLMVQVTPSFVLPMSMLCRSAVWLAYSVR